MNKAILLVVVSLLACNSSNPLLQKSDHASGQTMNVRKADDAQIVEILHDAYLVVYPLVLMEMARRSFGFIQRPGNSSKTFLNRFAHTCIYENPAAAGVDDSDNWMFYSSAFTDVSKEPVVLHVPDEMGRYYRLLLVDDWGRVFNTATHSGSANFLITAPGWRGAVPAGMLHISAPTSGVWVVGQTQIYDKTDAVIVRSLVNRYSLTALGEWERGEQVDRQTKEFRFTGTAPDKLLLNMKVGEVLQLANRLMENTPPHWDEVTQKRMSAVQVGPGKKFDLSEYNSTVQSRLKEVPLKVLKQMTLPASDKPTLLQLLHSSVSGKGSVWLSKPETNVY